MSYGVPAPDAGSEQAPVCPRHPDRVSYVRCQRCGRPACAECQRPAAVGFQCVDCVREQAANAPVRKNAFGGVARGGTPIVTYTLIGLCVVVFLLQMVIPGFIQVFAYRPVNTAGVESAGLPAEPWRMLTAAFLHSPGSILHIGFNMYALFILGRELEPAMGRARFLTLYLLSALGGSVGVLLLSNPGQFVVGASGAVFGLFGALFIIQRKRGGDVRQIVVLIAINAVLGFVVPNVAWQAHLGGLITGAACAAAIAYAPRGARQARTQWLGIVGVGVGLVALTALGVALLPF